MTFEVRPRGYQGTGSGWTPFGAHLSLFLMLWACWGAPFPASWLRYTPTWWTHSFKYVWRVGKRAGQKNVEIIWRNSNKHRCRYKIIKRGIPFTQYSIGGLITLPPAGTEQSMDWCVQYSTKTGYTPDTTSQPHPVQSSPFFSTVFGS